jgi:hypothetical protein
MSPYTVSLAGGKSVDLLNFDASEISIEIIASALSKICRFTGQCDEFYSVAQHSVFCADLVPEEFQMQALLHDMSEAVIGDMVRPLKRMMPEYRDIENTLEIAMRRKFYMPEVFDPSVHVADNIALLTEIRDLMPEMEPPVFHNLQPHAMTLVPRNPKYAEAQFLATYYRLRRNPCA